MTIQRITCQICGSLSFERGEAGELRCASCGHTPDSARQPLVCSTCGTANPPAARRCMNCGLGLGKLCPVCRHLNGPGVELCESCGTPLDRLAALGARAEAEGPGSVVGRTRWLGEQKAMDQAFMVEQRQVLDEEERARLARLAERQQQAQAEQRRIALWAAAGLLALFGLAALGIALAQLIPAG